MAATPDIRARIPLAAQQAWHTLTALPLASAEQQDHAREVLQHLPTVLVNDVRRCDLFLSADELAALRVMLAWLIAARRAGRLADLPCYPELGEAIISRLGGMPWAEIFDPSSIRRRTGGAYLQLHPQTEAPILRRLISAALRPDVVLCPGWSPADRQRLKQLLRDIYCWLEALEAAMEPSSTCLPA